MTLLTSILLEFSEDPMSDVSPTWTDVTSDLVEIEWWAGVSREGDEPDAGGATIRLKNRSRRWEPDYTAGMFYPNITTGRRFRLTLNDGLGAVQQGVWYVTDIQLEFVGGTKVSRVTMACGDGFEVLALDDMPLLDPPDADTYADVVSSDEPWGYWRLGDPEGTRLVSHLKMSRARRGKGKKRRRVKHRWYTRETVAELEGVTGPTGTYKNSPLLGQRSLVLGDTDKSVEFVAASTHWVRVPLEADDLRNAAFTLEAIVNPSILGVQRDILTGPVGPGGGAVWGLRQTSGDQWSTFVVVDAGPTSVTVTSGAVAAGLSAHLAATWNGATLSLYVDGALLSSAATGTRVGVSIGASPAVQIGSGVSGNNPYSGLIDEAAVYESALSAERVEAHWLAMSARGLAENNAGYQISEIAAHALWSEASIQTSGRMCEAQMMHGQPRVDMIGELAHAEGPTTMFFFNGSGDPVYLGHEWEASSSSYYTPQATFGDGAGEVSYELDGVEFVYDNETYNDVTVSHESGELANATDTTAISERGRRVNTDYTDVLLMEHTDVESLADRVLGFYKDPALRPVALTLNAANPVRVGHILRRDIGHLIRVKRRGEGGTPIDRVTSIIGKRKHLNVDKHLTCTWTLGRGFNASADNAWHAGIAGFSEAGQTTDAA